MNKWTYEIDLGSDIWRGEICNTKEEAIKAGNSEATGYKREYFKVGIAKRFENCGIDVNKVIEDMQDAMDEAVGEVAEGYLEGVTGQQLLDLEEQLNKVFCTWGKKYNHDQTFYEITDVEILKTESDKNE